MQMLLTALPSRQMHATQDTACQMPLIKCPGQQPCKCHHSWAEGDSHLCLGVLLMASPCGYTRLHHASGEYQITFCALESTAAQRTVTLPKQFNASHDCSWDMCHWHSLSWMPTASSATQSHMHYTQTFMIAGDQRYAVRVGIMITW